MNTDPGSIFANVPSAAAEMASELPNTLGSMDTLAAQRLETLQRVQQGRLSQLSRALAEAQAQYPPDSQAVQTAQAAVAAASATVGRVSMAQQQMATPDPEVTSEGWALHGRVFDAQLQPASGFTVFMVDGQKTYQQAFGFSYTDATGYFLINYAGPQSSAAGPADGAPPSTRASGQTTPKARAGSAAQSTSAQQLFLAIADSKAQPVFLSNVAFEPVTGGATYQNIVLSPGNQPIGDPPREIRDIALPKAAKKKRS
jgi:hypothetical protein